MGAIMALAQAHGIAVIEDCVQAFLAQHEGRHVGTIGAIGCFSLKQGKHITTGEGGLVTTNDAALAWRMSLAPGRGATAIPFLKLVMGAALVVIGSSVTDLPGDVATMHGAIHNVASYVTLTATWTSCFVFAARFAARARLARLDTVRHPERASSI